MPNKAAPGPRFSADPQIERSLNHSIRDGISFAAMGGMAENYFTAFAVHLRATTAEVGVLASLPPLLGALGQLGSVWLGRATGWRKAIIVGGALLQALALVPLMVLPHRYPAVALPLLILCAIVYWFGPNMGGPQWGSLMGDLVPEKRRGRFFARRTRLSSLSGFVALIVAGSVLHVFQLRGIPYWGFVAIFSGAALCRLVSAWHLAKMLDPPRSQAPRGLPLSRDFWRRVRSSQLLRFSLFFAGMQFAVSIAGPYFALYMLRDLHFSYLAFMANTATTVAVQFLTLNRWGRISDLFGNRLVLRTTGTIIPFIPLLWLASTNYVWLLVVQAVSGLCWAGFTLSAQNSVFELTPPPRRATLMALHGLFAACAVFCGAVLGAWLGMNLPREIVVNGEAWSWLSPLYGVMVFSALCRMAVVGLFLRRLPEPRRVRRMTRLGVIFRITRFTPGGVGFDSVLPFLRRRDDE